MSFPAISFDGVVGAEAPEIGDRITAMTGVGAEARPRRARVTARHSEIGGGLTVTWQIGYAFVQEAPGDGNIVSHAGAADEGIVWARGWGDEIDAVLRATYVLHDPTAASSAPNWIGVAQSGMDAIAGIAETYKKMKARCP